MSWRRIIDSRVRTLTVAATAASLLLMLTFGTLMAATQPMGWHRLNIYSDPPEHERFGCLADDTWQCRYDKIPGPGLAWDQTRGTFAGTETLGWICPDWFPTAACAAADTVVTGVATFVQPRHSGEFDVDQQLLVSDDGSLWIYWTDQFVCPWHSTFAGAISSDESCTFAP